MPSTFPSRIRGDIFVLKDHAGGDDIYNYGDPSNWVVDVGAHQGDEDQRMVVPVNAPGATESVYHKDSLKVVPDHEAQKYPGIWQTANDIRFSRNLPRRHPY